jgi:hypothetical protein
LGRAACRLRVLPDRRLAGHRQLPLLVTSGCVTAVVVDVLDVLDVVDDGVALQDTSVTAPVLVDALVVAFVATGVVVVVEP